MSPIGIAGAVLVALAGAGSSSQGGARAPTSPSQGTIEIVVAGPEDARTSMVAAIRGLLGPSPDVRVTQASLPAAEAPSGPSGRPIAQIRIDVSDPPRLRVYLRDDAEGRSTVRTVPAKVSGSGTVDPTAREAVAQIVKASILALKPCQHSRKSRRPLTPASKRPLPRSKAPPATNGCTCACTLGLDI